MIDPVDEFWLPSFNEYEGKTFKSITKGNADLSKFKVTDDNDKKKKQKPLSDKALEGLISEMKSQLEGKVKDIKVSQVLTDSPVCLTADEGEMDMHLERLMRQHKRVENESKKILEINGNHDLVKSLAKLVSDSGDKKLVGDISHLLLDQARISEGELPVDTKNFTDRLSSIMTRGLKV